MRTLSILMFVSALFLFCASGALAQMPQSFSYQGVLADAAGAPVADGSYTLTFKLYDARNTPTPLWTEAQVVSVRGGVFNVLIGSVTALTLPFDKGYYLGVSVDGGSELLPRTELAAAPYALVSSRAELASGLEPGASGVVTSVNTISGDVTLEGGGATTVTRSGNKITISSTGGTGGTGIQGVQNTDGTMSVQNPNGPVATIGLADNGIGGIKLQDGGITEPKLAVGSISKDKIKQNEVVKSIDVNGTKMRDDIVLAAGTNVTLTPSGNKVTISAAGGTGGTGIQGVQNADGTIEVQNPSGPTAIIGIADNAVGTTKIANNAVTEAKVANGQLVKSVKVGSVNLYDEVTFAAGNNVTLSPSGNTITIAAVGGSGGSGIQAVQNTNATLDILNGTGPIATINVSANSINSTHLADNAVTGDKLADGTVSAGKLANGVLPTSLPPSGAAGGDLGGAYPNPTIAANAVSTVKLLDGAVTSTKLASGVIPTALPPNGTASGDLAGTYPNPTIAVNAISSTKILDGSIATADLANASVTPGKIDGSSASTGQVLSWDGSSVIWTTPSSGGVSGSGSTNQLTVWSGSGSISGNSNLVYSGSKLGVGISSPSATVHVVGDDGLYATGTFGSGSASSPGSGARLHWYPKKAAFRVGSVTGSQWDDGSIGNHSIAMGRSTTALGTGAVALGAETSASGNFSIATGNGTTASGTYSTSMGRNNTASGASSTALGYGTSASGAEATAIGWNTVASGVCATAIGFNTTAFGDYSTALGAYVKANGSGSFMIGDMGTTTTLIANTANTFMSRFVNGYWLATNFNCSLGVRLLANGTSWTTISDSTRKEGYREIDGESLLTRFSKLRIGSWNYKGQDPVHYRHYGPMAQEWFAAFGHDGVGTIGNDTTLATADVDGILCIAIQALEKRTAELKKTSAQLEKTNAELRETKEQLATVQERNRDRDALLDRLLHRVAALEHAAVNARNAGAVSAEQASLVEEQR